MKNAVIIIATIERRTKKAILIRDRSGIEAWLPKSQINCSDPDLYGEVTIDLPKWLAAKKGLA